MSAWYDRDFHYRIRDGWTETTRSIDTKLGELFGYEYAEYDDPLRDFVVEYFSDDAEKVLKARCRALQLLPKYWGPDIFFQELRKIDPEVSLFVAKNLNDLCDQRIHGRTYDSHYGFLIWAFLGGFAHPELLKNKRLCNFTRRFAS